MAKARSKNTLRARVTAKPKPVKLKLFGDSTHNHPFFIVIGQLIIHWANNESLFFRVLVSLLDMNTETAAVVFNSHKNTTGRLDLVSALLKKKIKDEHLTSEFDRLVSNFKGLSKKRHFFAHCMYSYEGDPPALSVATGVIFDNQSQSFRHETVRMDAKTIRQIDDANMKFVELNQRLWDFVHRLDAHLAGQPPEQHEAPDA